MNYIFYPKQDASIYEYTSSLNTGLDQILEISHTDNYNNRSLIQFDNNSILSYIQDNNITNYQAKLKVFTVDARNLPLEFNIEILPISGAWDMGKGRWYHEPRTTTQVNWKNKKSNIEWITGSYNANTTGSYITTSGGGNWYTNYTCTQSFDYITSDINTNITNIVAQWVSGSIENNGLILKLEDSIEKSTNNDVFINFFSNETNTIFPPQLHILWDDQVYVTGSSSLIDINNLTLYPKLKREYRQGELTNIEIIARKRTPTISFTTSSQYLVNNRLPSSSYYSIIDNVSNNVIIDYSEYTKISHNNNINYFKLNTDFLFPNRTYTIGIKVVKDNDTIIYKHNYPFKVIK